MNQDVLGKPAISLLTNDLWDIQLKPLADGNYALAFFNLGAQPAIAPNVDLSWLGLGETFRVRDLWSREDLGTVGKNFVVGVEAHSAKLYKVFMP